MEKKRTAQLMQRLENLSDRVSTELQKAFDAKDWSAVERYGRVGKEIDRVSDDVERHCAKWEVTLNGGARTSVSPEPDESYAGKQPVGFELNGREYPCLTWGGHLETLANVLRDKHRKTFDQKASTISGRKMIYFATRPDGMRNAHKLKNEPSLYVELNLSADSTIKLCRRLLAAVDPDANFRVIS